MQEKGKGFRIIITRVDGDDNGGRIMMDEWIS